MYSGWYGVDFDGTLAEYDEGQGGLGAPIPLMLNRVKEWIAAGRTVKIVTARAYMPEKFEPTDLNADAFKFMMDHRHAAQVAIRDIKARCVKHIGVELEVRASKDYCMLELWDDRAVQVIPNTGIPIAMMVGVQ